MTFAVIFDLGGVLVRTEDRAPRAALAARHGLTWEALDALVFRSESARLATLGKISAAEHKRRTVTRLGLSHEQAEPFFRQFFAGDQLNQPLLDWIRQQQGQRPIALLSNAWDDLPALLKTWGIENLFFPRIISACVGLAKPDPRIYRLVLQKIGLPARQALFIDDFAENIAAAQALGLQVHHFQDTAICLQRLERLPPPVA